MVVVALFSIAAAIIIPRFLEHKALSQRGGCEKNLRSLYDKERDYFAKTGTYTDSFEALSWKAPTDGFVYILKSDGKKDQFTALCEGNIDKDPAKEIVSINQNGELIRLSDDIRQ